jgi:hypothetical protein
MQPLHCLSSPDFPLSQPVLSDHALRAFACPLSQHALLTSHFHAPSPFSPLRTRPISNLKFQISNPLGLRAFAPSREPRPPNPPPGALSPNSPFSELAPSIQASRRLWTAVSITAPSRPSRLRVSPLSQHAILTSHFPLLTSHFPLLTSHFSLLTSHDARTSPIAMSCRFRPRKYETLRYPTDSSTSSASSKCDATRPGW